MPPADATLTSRAPARGLGPYAVVAGLGVLVAIGIAFGADRDPVAWMLPPLVVTALLLVLIRLIDRRPEERRLGEAAERLGLRFERARTLPPVTPLLAALPGARSVQTLEGELDVAGPPARLARIRLRGVDLAICLTDLPGSSDGLEDPHAILGRTGVVATPAAPGPDTTRWLRDHPLRIGYATGDDALVVFCPAARRDPEPFEDLLLAARELHPRLPGRL